MSPCFADTLIVYPAAGANSPVDGLVTRDIAFAGESWAAMISSAGTASDDTGTNQEVRLQCGNAAADQFKRNSRFIALFDTSSLTEAASISAADYSFVNQSKTNDLGGSPVMSLVLSSPASDNALINADYGAFTKTKQAADMAFASITSDDSTYNDMALNGTGLGNISKTGITKLGMMWGYDADSTTPPWASGFELKAAIRSADNADTKIDPKLTGTFTLAAGGTGNFFQFFDQ